MNRDDTDLWLDSDLDEGEPDPRGSRFLWLVAFVGLLVLAGLATVLVRGCGS